MARKSKKTAKEKGIALARNVRGATRTFARQAENNWHMALEETESYVRRKPITALVIAAGAGLALGAALSAGISKAHHRKSYLDRVLDLF